MKIVLFMETYLKKNKKNNLRIKLELTETNFFQHKIQLSILIQAHKTYNYVHYLTIYKEQKKIVARIQRLAIQSTNFCYSSQLGIPQKWLDKAYRSIHCHIIS